MGTITLTSPVAGTEIQAGLHATNYAALQTLLNGQLDEANIDATADLDNNARVGVRKNSAGSTFERRRINLIEGANVTLTVADDSANEEVDITIASASSAPTTYRKTTEKDVVSSTTETDLLNGEITVGAGVMGTDKMLRCTLIGDYLNNTGGTLDIRVRVKFGGTTLWDETSSGQTTSASRRPFRIVFEIANLGAANSQFMAGHFAIGTTGATTGLGDLTALGGGPNLWGHAFSTSGTSALDTATSKLLEVTVQHPSSSASLSARLKFALVQVL